MGRIDEAREARGLVWLTLDGASWLKIRKKHFARMPLEAGDAVDPESYLDRMAALQAADCYEAALTLLDQAAQTRAGIARKLELKGYVAPAAQAAAARLCENGLIDDARYAQRMAQSQIGKPVGVYAVRRKLRARQLDEAQVEAAMSAFDDAQQAQACAQAAEKLWRKYAALPAREGRAKLSQALARRGFGWDAIRGAVDAVSDGDGEFD